MREFAIEEKLKKKLSKIFNKDKVFYTAVMNKFEEIISSSDINHYKNLRKPLQDFKRVHIRTSFVLIFKYVASEDKLVFYEIDHHDKIYK